MPQQDVQTFNLHFDTWRADRLRGLTGVKPFEFFCADQFLKEKSLSDKEILSGQVDMSDDGGVDGFYCFINGVLLDDTMTFDLRTLADIDLKIFQCIERTGYSPSGIHKLGVFIDDLLTFSRPPNEYQYKYHDKLTRLMTTFKTKFNELRRRSIPQITIEFLYITRLDIEPHRNCTTAANALVKDASNYYSETKVMPFRFLNISHLWTQFKVAKPKLRTLHLVESFETKEGWVGLAHLKKYYEFLKHPTPEDDGRPKIDHELFDSNVRGYQLTTRVNTSITNTLRAVDNESSENNAKKRRKPPEFWQLNNGITILSPTASSADKVVTMDNPQIVNGLQTSRRIFDYYRNLDNISESDDRRILVRIIKMNDENSRMEIVRATNDQNPMPAEAFLATQRVQYQIEDYFLSKGIFYDRRKGHYKSEGKPAADIVGIVELMQAVVAIIERRPDTARGRPRDYLKDGKRQRIFGADDDAPNDDSKPYPLDVYLRCIQILRKIDSYLIALDMDDGTTLNLRFYLALSATVGATRNAYCPPGMIMALDVERDFTDTLLVETYQRVSRLYRDHGQDDDAVKGPKMRAGMIKGLKARYSPSRKSRRKAQE